MEDYCQSLRLYREEMQVKQSVYVCPQEKSVFNYVGAATSVRCDMGGFQKGFDTAVCDYASLAVLCQQSLSKGSLTTAPDDSADRLVSRILLLRRTKSA